MYKGKTFLAIVPARGGSKRLPRKNMLDLNGKPLIAWTLEAGIKSRYIDDIIVTSDDEEILSMATQYAVSTVKRPEHLASDTASSFDAVMHAVAHLSAYDYIVLLQPTSPLREAKHIDEAVELLESKHADAVVSVCETEHSPLWSNTLPKDGNMVDFLREDLIGKRTQDLETFYRLNGAVYICQQEKLLQEKRFFLQQNIYAYVMSKESSVDIDEALDFRLAELLLTERAKV